MHAIGRTSQLTESSRLSVNRSQVVRESFEDEVVIVNLENGAYYSLTQSGVMIWEMMERCWSIGEMTLALSGSFSGSNEEIGAEVLRLAGELMAEGLVVETAETPAQYRLAAVEGRVAFPKPEMSKFTDMEELLLLDPIHDVDETGWPMARPEGQ